MPANSHCASSIKFYDDTQLQSHPNSDIGELVGAHLERDFLVSRLNDETSYFYSWFSKRFQFKLKSNKQDDNSCPICLESGLNKIELQCGHSFCRSCLTTSAAMKISTCPMCRANIVLNPTVLRRKFHQKRIKNFMKRLGNFDHPSCISSIPWPEAVGQKTCFKDLSCRRQVGRSESFDIYGNFIHPAPSHKAQCAKNSKSDCASVNCVPTQSNFDMDVGAASIDQLRSSYTHLVTIAQCHCECDRTDIGDLTLPTLKQSWTRSLKSKDQHSWFSDVGSIPLHQMSRRWFKTCELISQFHPSIPDPEVNSLNWWRGTVKGSLNDPSVGELENSSLISRWASVNEASLDSSVIFSSPNYDLPRRWEELQCLSLINSPSVGYLKPEHIGKRYNACHGSFYNDVVGSHSLDILRTMLRKCYFLQVSGSELLSNQDVGEDSSDAIRSRYSLCFMST